MHEDALDGQLFPDPGRALHEGGQLQLNAFEPLIIYSIHEAVTLLEGGVDNLVNLCIRDIEADEDRCAENLGRSMASATALVPLLGYKRAAEIAILAMSEKRLLRDVLEELEPEFAANWNGI